jgi:hypothetical protein
LAEFPNASISITDECNCRDGCFSDPSIVAAACNVMVYPWMENARDRAFLRLLNMTFRFAFLIGRPCTRGEFKVFRNIGIRYDTRLYSGENCEIMGRRLGFVGKAIYLNHVTVYESPRDTEYKAI